MMSEPCRRRAIYAQRAAAEQSKAAPLEAYKPPIPEPAPVKRGPGRPPKVKNGN